MDGDEPVGPDEAGHERGDPRGGPAGGRDAHGVAVGFDPVTRVCGAGALAVDATVVLDDGSVDTYRILAPSTWTTSPEGPFGNPGPCERAIVDTPLLEKYTDADDFTGVDILRAVRSLDPCMVCATH